MHPRIAVCLLTVLCACFGACNDRTQPPPIEFAPTPERDAGGGSADLAEPVTPDEVCEGESDGHGCALENAAGVCVRQECRLVSCISGFEDCDGRPGCETNLSAETSCGACDNTCDAEQACLSGPDGFVCAAGSVCPVDRFDLDGDRDNGCEWQAVWESAFTLVPPSLSVDTGRWERRLRLAGTAGDRRVSVVLGDTPQPLFWDDVPAEPATAIDVREAGGLERVLWTDGLSLRDTDGASAFVEPPCEQEAMPRRFVAATERFVATRHNVFRIDDTCDDLACLEPVYGYARYLRDFLPHVDVPPGGLAFVESELTQCDRCLHDDAGELVVAPGCAGGMQCVQSDFDAAECQDCDPTGCPGLRVVGLAETPSFLFVVTGRGVIVLSAETREPVARAEAPWDPAVSGGPRYVGARVEKSDDSTTLHLLHSSGELRTIVVDHPDESPLSLVPAPPFGLGVDPETAALVPSDPLFAIVADDQARVVLPLRASARVAFLTMESAPGIQGLRPFEVVDSPTGIRFLYLAAGQVFPRLVERVEQ